VKTRNGWRKKIVAPNEPLGDLRTQRRPLYHGGRRALSAHEHHDSAQAEAGQRERHSRKRASPRRFSPGCRVRLHFVAYLDRLSGAADIEDRNRRRLRARFGFDRSPFEALSVAVFHEETNGNEPIPDNLRFAQRNEFPRLILGIGGVGKFESGKRRQIGHRNGGWLDDGWMRRWNIAPRRGPKQPEQETSEKKVFHSGEIRCGFGDRGQSRCQAMNAQARISLAILTLRPNGVTRARVKETQLASREVERFRCCLPFLPPFAPDSRVQRPTKP
jgi:hypothetical protein